MDTTKQKQAKAVRQGIVALAKLQDKQALLEKKRLEKLLHSYGFSNAN